MDILKLNPTTYFPDNVVEGLTAKVWTERFLEHGDFLFKTRKIAEIKETLPKGTFISHTETKETMMVEDLVETTADDGAKELSVTGRSVDHILESRWVESQYQKRRLMNRSYSSAGASLVLLWQAVDNASGWDVTRQRKGDDHDGDRWPWNTKDILPNVIVTETTTGVPDLTNKRWWLTEGLVYEQLVKILNRGDFGIRTIRPGGSDFTDVNLISVDSSVADLGLINRTDLTSTSALRFDLFRGIDRSHLQEDNPQVVFNVLKREVTQPNYVESLREWKTCVEVMSGGITISDVYRNAGQADNTGWDRRIIGFDAGTPEIPERPDNPTEAELAAWKNKRDAILAEFEEDAREEAERILKDHRMVYLFSGNIAPSNPFIFKKDYNLGDAVSIKGEYDLTQKMIVQEYIRTDDAEGDRGYPGLVLA